MRSNALSGKMETGAAFENKEAAIFLGLGALAVRTLFVCGPQNRRAGWALRERVVAFDEAARAADHEQTHQLAPVVGIHALLERRETIYGALVLARELVHASVAITPEIFLGADANNVFRLKKEPNLVCKVEVGFVVRRSRNENALAGVAGNIIADGGPTPALAISEIMALVNDDHSEATQIRENVLGLRCRDNFRNQAVTVCV